MTTTSAASPSTATEPEPHREPSLPADVLVPAFHEPYFPFLADEDSEASVSVGTVTTGHLVNARILPLPGLEYDILERQRSRGLMYGTEEMIEILRYAGAALYAQHGTRLWLGNIGKRGGGDIPWSVSHNTGRDADIAFCYLDPNGQPVDPPDLVHLDKDGRSVQHDGFYRFDVAGTWTVIEALLSFEGAQVQYLFISNHLKSMLLRHAQRKGVRAELRQRADATLGQPGLALPHNDHIHVRLYCSRRDVEGGCINFGKEHPWADLYQGARASKIARVSRHLQDPQPEQRARATERLVLLGARGRLPQVAQRLGDDSPRVRSAAALALGKLGGVAHTPALTARFALEPDAMVKRDIIRGVADIGGARAGAFLALVILGEGSDEPDAGSLPAHIVRTYTRPVSTEAGEAPAGINSLSVVEPKWAGVEPPLPKGLTVRLAAIDAAAGIERREPVPSLITMLEHGDPVVRGRAARALRQLTNHSFDSPWDHPDVPTQVLAKGIEDWRDWQSKLGAKSRNEWLLQGFQRRGYQVSKVHVREVWRLVPAIMDEDHLSYNAQRLLMRLSAHHPASLTWSRDDACWHWTRWFNRRHRKYRISEAPPELAHCNR